MPLYHGTELITPIIRDKAADSPVAVLTPINITNNGTYNPIDYSANGFSQVVVNVKPTDTVHVTPSKSSQVITNTGNGIGKVYVDAVTSSIDENILQENIKQGINILGIVGTYKGLDTSDATAQASNILEGYSAYVDGNIIYGTMKDNSTVYDIYPTSTDISMSKGYYNSFVVHGDSNLNPENIKKNITIFGVKGTYEEGNGEVVTQDKVITPTENTQTIYPDEGKYINKITVNPISKTFVGSEIARRNSSDLTVEGLNVNVPSGYYNSSATVNCHDDNLVASNIKRGVTIFGVNGSYEPNASDIHTLQNYSYMTYFEKGATKGYYGFRRDDGVNLVVILETAQGSTLNGNESVAYVGKKILISNASNIRRIIFHTNPTTFVNNQGNVENSVDLGINSDYYISNLSVKFPSEITNNYDSAKAESYSSTKTISFSNMDNNTIGNNEEIVAYTLIKNGVETNLPSGGLFLTVTI